VPEVSRQLDRHHLPAVLAGWARNETVRVALRGLRLEPPRTLLGFGSGHYVMVRRCHPARDQTRRWSTNKRLARRALEEIYANGDLELADEHPDFVDHEPAHPERPTGPEGVRQTVRQLHETFGDLRFDGVRTATYRDADGNEIGFGGAPA
jgi:hypothetical protein